MSRSTFPSNELAHVWAHQGQASGRRSDDYMSFDGPAFYSYRTVIARVLTTKGGNRVYLRDTYHFSNSTSKHQSHVNRAIPGNASEFAVSIGKMGQSLDLTPGELRDHYLTKYRTPNARSSSRYARIRAEDVQWRVGRLSEAIRVCQVFGLAHARLDTELANAQTKLTAANEVCRAAKVKSDAQSAKRKASERADKVARAISMAEAIVKAGVLPDSPKVNMEAIHLLGSRSDLKAAIVAMVEAKHKAAMDDWRAGGMVGQSVHQWPTMLRAEGDDMQTSKGARVPLSDAKRAYLFANRLRAKGWHRNGERFAVGMYELDAVNEQGIVAGCHRISWEEIDRFAALMDWGDGPLPDSCRAVG